MKNLFIIACLFVSTSFLAQSEWGDVNKNKLTMKEIAPVWPGCEADNSAKRDACFDQKLTQHIIKNFKYPATEYKNNVQGKVVVEFIINEKGMVDVKNVTGGNAGLQAEAKRNIMAIPKMKPGLLGGKPRAIKYTVPFNFKTGK
ncbi:energy transducer TonB [Ulvibacter antarcticus]|uniref:TonB family protein n=1 Tax=Ulvibacter antarcticus TaxID=442714 RepID=A0A3L9YB92_9FLAO|nr:energy transducer TonB [Ulvibacter antarcticus]RMA57614.1 TonB family protein [Ulvibacter antarcticus]